MNNSDDRALQRELLPNGAVWGKNAYSGEDRCQRCRHIHKTTRCAACGCKPPKR